MNAQINYYEEKLKYEMDSADLFEALERQELIEVLDVRKEKAYRSEHIPVATSFPHREMNKETVSKLNKDVLYVCYCDGIGCNGSTKGALKLAKLGFKTKELLGGLDWWKRDGYTTLGSDGVKGTEISCNC